MHVRQRLGASERHACHVLGQPRSTQRRVKKVRVDESALRTDVIRLASRFGRYGYRQITNLLRIEGWEVNHKRVERIWRQEGLKVPRRQPKRGVKSRVVCKSERKLLDASVRLPWRPPSVREA